MKRNADMMKNFELRIKFSYSSVSLTKNICFAFKSESACFVINQFFLLAIEAKDRFKITLMVH